MRAPHFSESFTMPDAIQCCPHRARWHWSHSRIAECHCCSSGLAAATRATNRYGIKCSTRIYAFLSHVCGLSTNRLSKTAVLIVGLLRRGPARAPHAPPTVHTRRSSRCWGAWAQAARIYIGMSTRWLHVLPRASFPETGLRSKPTLQIDRCRSSCCAIAPIALVCHLARAD